MPLDPAVPVWPRKLAPQTIGHGATRPILVGPQPLSGLPQAVVSDTGAWRVTLSNIPIHDDGDRVRLIRSILWGTLAKGLPIYLPFYDRRRNARVRNGFSAFPQGATFGDGSTFSDGSTYAGVSQDVTIAIAAPARASTVVVDSVTGAAVPQPGEFIGLGDRVHVVNAAFPDDTVDGRWSFDISPPLRAAVAVNDLVEVADPLCKMRLDPKQLETLLALDFGIVGRVSLDFLEANWT